MFMKLSTNEIADRLKNFSGWEFINNSLEKNITLKNFSEVLALVVRIGIEAEKMDHHPDLLIYGYKNLKINISTHSEGGITEKDFLLASKINSLLN